MTRKSILIRAAEKVLDENEIKYMVKSFDLIGDIAVIKLPVELLGKRFEIANALLEEAPFIKVVLRKVTSIWGKYRLMGLEWLAGEKRFETIYREHGCIFKVNLKEVFFSPRLSGERIRIARLVEDGEVIVNMFAGIGTFSIIIARNAKPRKIFSIDINPKAIELMKENIKMNKVEGIVIPILGDAAKMIENQLRNIADRVLMPLPELSLKYLKYALMTLRENGGWIHPYEFIRVSKNENPIEKAIKKYSEKLGEYDVEYRVVGGRLVGEVAPRKYRVVLDIKVSKTKNL